MNLDNNETKKFTQEVRLATPIRSRVDWLMGLFYTHEASYFTETTEAENATTGEIVAGSPDNFRFPTTYAEYAAFTDLTFHVTDQFDVQVGGRESHIKQSIVESEVGPYVNVFYGVPSPYLVPQVISDANAFTYLLTPSFKLSPDFMVYARLASGYRAGGPNAVPGVPTQYNPDKTENYELGAKGDFLNHVLSFDASLYYIDWKDIQLNLINPLGVEVRTPTALGRRAKGLSSVRGSKTADRSHAHILGGVG